MKLSSNVVVDFLKAQVGQLKRDNEDLKAEARRLDKMYVLDEEEDD